MNCKILAVLLALVVVANAQRCDTCLPGLDMGLGYSFDIIYGLPPKFQIIPWTYTYGDQWYNPYDLTTYLIPDQLNIVNNPRFVGIDSEYFFRQFREYQISKSQSFGISLGITGIAQVAFSQEKGQMQYNMRDLIKAASLVKRDFSLYQLSIWPGEIPNRHFKRAIDALPAAYDADAYTTFVATWGTHYVDVIGLGASFNISTFINQDIINKKTESWVKNEISISLTYKFISLGLKYANAQNGKTSSEDFLKNADVKTGAIGGNPLLIESQNYQAWVASIAGNPGPMKFHASDMAQMVLAVSNRDKANNVKRAIAEYIASAAAGGPRRILETPAVNGVPIEFEF
jgi:hypothetical protein